MRTQSSEDLDFFILNEPESEMEDRNKWLFLQHAYPPKIILEVLGLSWMFYLFWHHVLIAGILVAVIFFLIGTITTIRVNRQKVMETPMGRFLSAIMNPVNISVQLLGYLVFAYGMWEHSGFSILSGISIILLGHAWGWRKIYGRAD